MSRSNPTLTNPAEHFFEWKGSKGVLQWYDKEHEKNVPVKLPFEFLVLDELNTITGYSKQDESGFWANEVRYIKEDTLYVKTKRGPVEEGLYSELRSTGKGAKYAKSIYLAHKIGDDWVIGNFKAHGSAVSAWFEFSKKYVTQKGKIIMKQGTPAKTPNGDDFIPPAFEWVKSDAAEDAVAIKLDKELQAYLATYLKAPKDEFNIDHIEPDHTNEEQADFEKRRDNASRSNHEKDVAEAFGVDDEYNKPISLDEIPF